MPQVRTHKSEINISTLHERLSGSLLFDPGEKREIMTTLEAMGAHELQVLSAALDREDELLSEALKRDGARVTRIIEGYVEKLNAESYAAKRKLLSQREAEQRRAEQSDAERTLSEIPA